MDESSFQEAGLYDPDGPTASDRLALLRFLVERGATVEQMQEADADGRLFALSAGLAAFGPVERIALGEVAARAGTTEERIRRLLLAEGIPVDENTLLPAFVVDDAKAFALGRELFGDEATLAFTRVVGAAVSRIVDAAISLFYGDDSLSLSVDAGELERAQVNERAGAAFALVPSVVTHLIEQFFRQDAVRSTSRLGDGAGQTATVGIGFVDLVGSTQWARTLSLKDYALALSRFESAAWDIATEHGGRVVKLIGDEAMIVSASAESTSQIALALCAAVAGDGSLPGARGCVGFGDVTARGGDYVGPLVNLVSRAVKVAREGTVVVTTAVRDRLPEQWHSRLVDIGSHTLRGIEEETALFAISGEPSAGESSAGQEGGEGGPDLVGGPGRAG
jgi:adenylate cyclase